MPFLESRCTENKQYVLWEPKTPGLRRPPAKESPGIEGVIPVARAWNCPFPFVGCAIDPAERDEPQEGKR